MWRESGVKPLRFDVNTHQKCVAVVGGGGAGGGKALFKCVCLCQRIAYQNGKVGIC